MSFVLISSPRMNLIATSIFFTLIFLQSEFTSAQTSQVGLSLDEYPHARVVFRSVADDDDYILALGSFKKTEGTWSVDHHQRLSGQLARMTLELPQTHSAEDGFQFYSKQLKKLSARELYRCDARECGPSNSWANNHFKVIQLYGLDQHQYYAAYEVLHEQQLPYYVSLYAVLRGNKRVYVQIDILQSDKATENNIATDPASLSRLLQDQGFFVFPGIVTDDENGKSNLVINKEHLQGLITVLQRQYTLQVALVGHDYRASSLQTQQKDSERYAESLKAALVGAGIAANRIEVYGLGGLSPAGRGNQSARVEVVKLNK